jgi:hypothetical protein
MPCLAEARAHLVSIEVEEGKMTLEEKTKVTATAYLIATSQTDGIAESKKCLCGKCHQCVIKDATIPIRDALLLYCLALGGHRDREACKKVIKDVFDAVDGKKEITLLQSQLLNSYKHIVDGIPGTFSSRNSCTGRTKRPAKGAAPGSAPRSEAPVLGGDLGKSASSCAMYLTCSFVPAGLECAESLKVQINSLLSHMVPDYSGPALCADCVGALHARLQEVPRAALWSEAGTDLTMRVLGALSSVMRRQVSNPAVQWGCAETMLGLLRRRGDALALQLSLAPVDPTCDIVVKELDAKISRQVWDAVLASRQGEGSLVFRTEHLHLLARTQKLSALLVVLAEDANALDEILDELHDSLNSCLVVLCLPDAQRREHARKLVWSIAEQQTILADTVVLDTESWARRSVELKGLTDNRELQTRCMLTCVLFGAEHAVFRSLMTSVDHTWLTAALRGVRSLYDAGLLGRVTTGRLVELFVGWHSDDRSLRLFQSDIHGSLRHEYVSTLERLLGGRSTFSD